MINMNTRLLCLYNWRKNKLDEDIKNTMHSTEEYRCDICGKVLYRIPIGCKKKCKVELYECEHYTTLSYDDDIVDLYFTDDEVEKLDELLDQELKHEENFSIFDHKILVLKKPSKAKEFYQNKLKEIEKFLRKVMK